MKTLINQLAMLSAITAMLFVTSCGSDDDDEPAPAGPSITVSLTSDQLITSDTVRAESGGTVSFDVDITAPAGFNTLRVTNGDTGAEVFTTNRNILGLDAGISFVPTLSTGNIELPVTETTESISLIFTVVDDNSGSAFETVVIEIEGDPAINAYTAVLLGGQLNATTGSFYNALDNMVYKVAGASTNDDLVDLLFYYVNTDGLRNIIASADNDEAQLSFEANGVAWPLVTENSTRFKAVAVGFDFDATTTSTGLANAYSEVGTGEERMVDLQVDEVFAFQTAASRGSRFGVIRVASIDGTVGSDRSITLDVKIQSVNN